MFVNNFLSRNTKSGYKDSRSLSFLIDKALLFAVLLVLITPRALHVLWIMGALFNSLHFQASNWLVGVEFSLKYVLTGLKPNLLLSNLCNAIFNQSLITKFAFNKSYYCIFRICIANNRIQEWSYWNSSIISRSLKSFKF